MFIAPKAIAATNAAAGALAIFKKSFIVFSILTGWFCPAAHMGFQGSVRHAHQSNLKYDNHMKASLCAV
jgi:hypothetical protein